MKQKKVLNRDLNVLDEEALGLSGDRRPDHHGNLLSDPLSRHLHADGNRAEVVRAAVYHANQGEDHVYRQSHQGRSDHRDGSAYL